MNDSTMTDPNKPDNEQAADDDWASALAEQQSETAADGEPGDAPAADDAWGDAMAEQRDSETATATAEAPEPTTAGRPENAESKVFKPLQDNGAAAVPRELDMIMEIPVTLSVELGSTRLTIRELLDLAQGSVVELDGLAGEPMDILINGYLIAQGEVVVVDDKYGIRITEIITPSERIHKLNR